MLVRECYPLLIQRIQELRESGLCRFLVTGGAGGAAQMHQQRVGSWCTTWPGQLVVWWFGRLDRTIRSGGWVVAMLQLGGLLASWWSDQLQSFRCVYV